MDRTMLAAARNVAVDAALAAGRFIRAEAGRVDPEAIRDKGVHDLVTHVDLGAQALILERIAAVFPGHDVLAEEDTGGAPTSASDFRWIVDPIDGTTNFAHGVPPYAVSIALEYGGIGVVGVVYDVSRDELFTAVRGEGASMNGRAVRVSPTDSLADSLLTTGFPYRSFDHVDAYFEVLREFFRKTHGVRRPGSASVDLAWVACGRFDGFFETGLAPWDVAAGTLLVLEAGGHVTDYGDGRDPVHDRQILASNGHIHAEMADVLRSMRGIRA